MISIKEIKMKAYVVNEFGKDARFALSNTNTPKPRKGELLVKVMATSINPVDNKILRNPDLGINPDPPAILHMDVSGEVTEVGDGALGFEVGQKVYGCAGGLQGSAGKIDGALAEYMAVDARLVSPMPAGLEFHEAAALPLVSITAWEALFDRTRIKSDDFVLIHGGTGGVGHIAIQLAKAHGARVATTVSSDHKARIAKDLGADYTINYRDETVEDYVARLTNGNGFDVVFDTVGGGSLDASLQAVRSSGQVASIIGHNDHDLTPMHLKGLSLHIVFMLLPMLTGNGREHHGEILRKVKNMVDGGALRPLIHDRVFSFSEINEAHEVFEQAQHIGKVTLRSDL